jgi:iron complex transport system permease protein
VSPTSGVGANARSSSPASDSERALRKRALFVSCGLASLLILSVALGLSAGRGSSSDPRLEALFLSMRAYRVGVAFFAGAALSVAGTIVQGLFRNPLASPEVLGTNAGALLGGKLALFVSFGVLAGRTPASVSPEMLVPFGCVFGALFALATVLSLSARRVSPVTLILTGYVLNGLFIGIGMFLSTLAQESFELQRAMSTFQSGSLSGSGSRQLLLVAVMASAATLPALAWSRSLDLLLAGEEEASSLGVEVARVRFWCVVWASLAAAGAVSVGGSVSFVGLIIPHAARRFTGPTHRYLLPAAFVAGGSFVVLCDALCRMVPLQSEFPLGVLTDLIGAPIFLWMLHRFGREGHYD